jgi:hypothetical protein
MMKRRAGGTTAPVLTLIVLSPVIGEVLSGATRLSFIFALLPEMMVWGCGTLLIREAVRRWGGDGRSLLLLGLGLAIAEEFLIQQTSLAPLPWLGSIPEYGRVWGVNWPYFVFMLGYEAVCIVLVPIAVVELLFPQQRREPWLRRGGLVGAAVVFGVGSFVAWFLWTQLARPNVFHVPAYHPPTVTMGAGALAIALLVAAAYAARRRANAATLSTPPRFGWLVLAAMVVGFPWYLLMTVVFAPRPDLPLWVPMVSAAIWSAAAFALARCWSSTAGWRDEHAWALCFGTLLVSMTAGFLGSSTWPRADVVAKIVLDVLAVAGMIALAVRIRRRAQSPV